MFSHAAYGLGIQSTFSLPELVASAADADVIIHQGRVDRLAWEKDDTGVGFWATASEVCYFTQGVGAFSIREGREIVIDPAPGVEERVLRLFLLGRALATLLHQRGLLVLHASAVCVHGAAVAFMGEKGWGKSAIAAAMHAGGHGFVADDIVAVKVGPAETVRVFPGFPQLKLWPDVVVSLGKAPEILPQLHPHSEKRAHPVVHGFRQTALPLGCIYVLTEGATSEIEPLQPREALVELVRHSSLARLLGATGTAPSHLRQCARLAGAVRVCRLQRQRSLRALPDLVRFVEDDLSQSVSNTHGRSAPS
jgi:hypothetical protein